MVLESLSFSLSLYISSISGVSLSSCYFVTTGVSITTWLAFIIFVLSKDCSLRVEPLTKYIWVKYWSCCHCFIDRVCSWRITIGEIVLRCFARSGITKFLIFSTIPHMMIWFSASLESCKVSNMMSSFETGWAETWHKVFQSPSTLSN